MAYNSQLQEVTCQTLTAASVSATSGDLDSTLYKGVLLYINVTAITGTSPTLAVTIQGKSPVSGTYYTILTSASITATGLTILRVYPGLTAAANLVANDIVPTTYRISSAIGGTTPAVTASITGILVY